MPSKTKPTRYWSKFTEGKEGYLGGWKKRMPQKERLKILNRMIKKISYATVIRKLNQLRNVTQDAETERKAEADMKALKKIYRS